MIIGRLTMLVGADSRGLARDLAPITSQLSALESRAQSVGEAMSSVRVPSGDGMSGASPVTGATADAANAIRASMSPLLGIGAQITTMLDRIGGTVVTLARRIDNAIKTPLSLKALDSLQAKFSETWIGAAAGAASAAVKIREYLGNIGDVARRDLSQVTRLNFAGSAAGLTGVRSAIGGVGAAAKSAVSPVRALGREIALATGLFGAAYSVVSFFKSAITSASNLNETVSKTGVVFGASASIVVNESNRLSQAFGLNKQEMLEAASNFGIMAKAAELGEKESAALSNRLVMLAADAASINNTSLEEALQKIRSGLAGESEPLRTFGVMLTEAAVKAEAARLGLARLGSTLTEGQKITARASLIQQQLSYASGDLERTLSGPANQFRSLAGTVGNLAASIGESLMPIVQPATRALSALVTMAAEGFESIKPQVESFARRSLAAVVEGLAKAADVTEMLYRNLLYAKPIMVDAFEAVKSAASSVATAIQSVARYALDAAKSVVELGLSAARTFDALTGTRVAGSLESLPNQIADLAKTIAASWQFAAPGESLGDKIRSFFADVTRGADAATLAATNAANAVESVAPPTTPKEIEALETKLLSQIAAVGKSGALEDDIAKLKETKGYQDHQFTEVRNLQTQLDLAKGRVEVEKELRDLAKQTIADTLTPLERYNARLTELSTLLNQGKIDSETFNRASTLSYRETMGSGSRFAGAAQAGSREAYQAILADFGRKNEEPVKVTAKNSEKQVAEAQKQTALMQRAIDLLAGKLNGESLEMFALGT